MGFRFFSVPPQNPTLCNEFLRAFPCLQFTSIFNIDDRSAHFSHYTLREYIHSHTILETKEKATGYNILQLCFAAFDNCTTNCSHFLRCESRQEAYNCTCLPGFSGFDCDINIDDCSSNPCVNGKCVDGVNRYDCDCIKGYWGKHCENKIINEGGMIVTEVIDR